MVFDWDGNTNNNHQLVLEHHLKGMEIIFVINRMLDISIPKELNKYSIPAKYQSTILFALKRLFYQK